MPIDKEDLTLLSLNTGGMNSSSSIINVTSAQQRTLLNVDVDDTGTLSKRKGSDVLIEYGDTKSAYVYSLITNQNLPITISIRNKSIYVYYSSTGNTLELLYQFDNVFRFENVLPNFVTLPGEKLKLLILTDNHPPIQLSIYDYVKICSSTSTTQVVPKASALINDTASLNSTKVFSNKRLLTSGVTKSIASSQLNLTFTDARVVGEELTSLIINWQWWAEAELYRGDNFYKSVPRFGATQADQNVEIPTSIRSDILDGTLPPYGIFAFIANTPALPIANNQYEYISNNNPQFDYQYSFGDGGLYEYSSSVFTVPSKFFLTFGKESGAVQYVINDDMITYTGSLDIFNNLFRTGDRVILNINGVSSGILYVKRNTNLSNTRIDLFSDQALTTPYVITPGFTPIVFASTAYDTVNDRITGTFTGINSYDLVRIRPQEASGIIDTGLSSNISYTAFILSGNTFLYLDSALKFRVSLNGGSANNSLITKWTDSSITKVQYKNVYFLRMRKLSFNNNTGIDESFLKVYRNDAALTFNTTPSVTNTGFILSNQISNLTTFVTTNGVIANYILIPNGYNLNNNDFVSTVNIDASVWVGSAAQSVRYVEGTSTTYNGSFVPAYGINQISNYLTGVFPSIGCVFNDRLILSGFSEVPNLIQCSSISDSVKPDETYRFFQIDENLSSSVSDPFDIVLPEKFNNKINAVVPWQGQLFAFTQNSVYRISSQQILSPTDRIVTLVSDKGVLNSYSVITTDKRIIFLSDSGVYDLAVIVQEEYRAGELSINIRDKFENTNLIDSKSWLAYYSQEQKLYVGLTSISGSLTSDKLFVYDLVANGWSEYYSHTKFNVFNGVEITDGNLRKRMLLSVKTPCFTLLLGMQSSLYVDYSKSVTKPNTLSTRFPRVVLQTYSTKRNYSHGLRLSPFQALIDVNVYYGTTLSTLSLLTHGTDWVKTTNGDIRLLFANITDGNVLVIVPNPEYSWLNTGLYINNLSVSLATDAFGSPSFTDECSTFNFNYSKELVLSSREFHFVHQEGDNPVTVADSAVYTVGQIYPTLVESCPFTGNVLFVNKRVNYVYILFKQLSQFTVDNDVYIPATTTSYFSSDIENLLSKQKFPTSAFIGLLADDNVNKQILSEFYDKFTVQNSNVFNLYKEGLQRFATLFQLIVYNNNVHQFSIDGYQLLIQNLDGSGHSRGSK